MKHPFNKVKLTCYESGGLEDNEGMPTIRIIARWKAWLMIFVLKFFATFDKNFNGSYTIETL